MSKLKLLFAGFALAIVQSLPASAATELFSVQLNGPNEFPSNASPGIGFGLVTLDLDATPTLRLQAIFANLTGNVTASHIHCCTLNPGAGTAGVATQTPFFTGFPVGGTSGTYDHTFDMTLASSFNTGFVNSNGMTPATAWAALVTGIHDGKAYLNIHSNVFPGGEIRGFLAPVPEPSTYAMLLAGLALLGFMVHRRR